MGEELLGLSILGALFAFISSSYLASIFTGYLLGKKRILSVRWFFKRRGYLTDPLSRKIHKWLTRHLMSSVVSEKWLNVFLLILLNNLLLGAFVLRTIYGVVFVLPYILTVWEGLGQGVVFSKYTKPNLIFLFEFGGYLFATLAGMSLGFSLLFSLQVGVEALLVTLKNMVYIYVAVIAFLSLGALLETLFMRKSKLPEELKINIDESNFEELLKDAVKRMLERLEANESELANNSNQ